MPSGNKPLPDPVLTKISNAIWRHQAPMSLTNGGKLTDDNFKPNFVDESCLVGTPHNMFKYHGEYLCVARYLANDMFAIHNTSFYYHNIYKYGILFSTQ